MALIAVLLGACGYTSGCCSASKVAGGSQPVLITGQQTSMWCWAASGEMCMDFLGTDVTQCDQANKRFGESVCCDSPTPTTCINGGWPEFEKYDFTYNTTAWGDPLAWSALKHEIYCAKKPFCFSWGWSGGGGHMMVATGFATIGGEDYVLINDPLPVGTGSQYWRTYDQYVDSTTYTHWRDYYAITKEATP